VIGSSVEEKEYRHSWLDNLVPSMNVGRIEMLFECFLDRDKKIADIWNYSVQKLPFVLQTAIILWNWYGVFICFIN
jgi:hypothetical protein